MKLLEEAVSTLEKDLEALTNSLSGVRANAPLNSLVLVQTLIRTIEATLKVARSVSPQKSLAKRKEKEDNA